MFAKSSRDKLGRYLSAVMKIWSGGGEEGRVGVSNSLIVERLARKEGGRVEEES